MYSICIACANRVCLCTADVLFTHTHTCALNGLRCVAKGIFSTKLKMYNIYYASCALPYQPRRHFIAFTSTILTSSFYARICALLYALYGTCRSHQRLCSMHKEIWAKRSPQMCVGNESTRPLTLGQTTYFGCFALESDTATAPNTQHPTTASTCPVWPLVWMYMLVEVYAGPDPH